MHLYCHDHPDTLTLETQALDARPGRVLLEASPFYPGGGGQAPDRGVLRWNGGEARVSGFDLVEGQIWHLLDTQDAISGRVELSVDAELRRRMRRLHTGSHILNALVYQAFDGALVTGVQLSEDGTARMDFDLPGADNDVLRGLEGPINDVVAQDLPVVIDYVDAADAAAQHGLIRSKCVAPPPTQDGRIRIVDIKGLDRQACGGTHLARTGAGLPMRILKIENKGRHNRRVRFGLVGDADV